MHWFATYQPHAGLIGHDLSSAAIDEERWRCMNNAKAQVIGNGNAYLLMASIIAFRMTVALTARAVQSRRKAGVDGHTRGAKRFDLRRSAQMALCGAVRLDVLGQHAVFSTAHACLRSGPVPAGVLSYHDESD